ncbi:MAG: LysR family transcriptional regulator [Hyphomicrobiales bacterium]|nr:LysR family transcriptional regulator [Hyphomicrobiales bacterium]MCP4998043.1 LysR family transcriptional regulator [Hyphomicrobiales bacterium]
MAAMHWEQVPYFLAVARAGSLRAAADNLNTTHAKINRHLTALETAYGVQLFHRTRAGVELTAAGIALLPAAEEAETLFLRAQRNLQSLDRQETGVVRFSLTGTMAYEIVSPILARFFEVYPQIDLEIRVTDQFEDIARLETDVSLRVAYEVTDDVVAQKLFPIAMGTYASRDYLARYLPGAGPKGEGLHWIGWDGPQRHPSWVEQTPFPNAEVRHATSDPVLHVSLLRNGFGISSMAVYFESLYPELVRVPETEITTGRTLWLLLHSDLRRTTRVRRFVDFMAAGLKELKPQLQGNIK